MRILFALTLMTVVPCFVGCGSAAPPKPVAEHGHEHAEHGPHGGDLIELGDEEYHAELIHDEKANDVTIYLLDKTAKSAVDIEATELVINLKQGDQPAQHKLVAEQDAGDAPGKSSRFVAKGNAELCTAMDQEGSEPRLQVTIQGKSYTGKIEHDHAEHAH